MSQHTSSSTSVELIDVSQVSKSFGPVPALRGVSFTVGRGRVTGMVGPNGAGKSTVTRVILGLHRPDACRALVDGRPYRDVSRPLTRVGSLLYLPPLLTSLIAEAAWQLHISGLWRLVGTCCASTASDTALATEFGPRLLSAIERSQEESSRQISERI